MGRYLNIIWFISTVEEIDQTVKYLQWKVIGELAETFYGREGGQCLLCGCAVSGK